jgi:aminoglycoside phosphotransferase (APT) family kinase protein
LNAARHRDIFAVLTDRFVWQMIEGINVKAVTRWLCDNIEEVVAPLAFSLIAGGHSNLTFRVVDANGRALVLRRPPLGHVLESAHDMGREHKIIAALAGSNVPVAPALGLCTDITINDAPFYIMNFVEGIVLDDATAAANLSLTERASIGQHVVEVLCNLHTIDVEGVGLGDLGRREAYLDRQLRRWTKQWESSKTDELPEMDEAIRLLVEQKPQQVGFTIVHGDYRLGNMIVGDGVLRAVLDWELCTLGDPLADLGYLLNSWDSPGDVAPGGDEQGPVTAGGFPNRGELTTAYAHGTGRDLSHINYYRAFSHWRLAAIGQGVYKRYLVGAMGTDRDFDLDTYKQLVTVRAEAALELLTS